MLFGKLVYDRGWGGSVGYVGTGASVSLIHALARSTIISNVEQKISGKLTHLIGRTRSMQKNGYISSGKGGITYKRFSTSTYERLHLWKASEISHLER